MLINRSLCKICFWIYIKLNLNKKIKAFNKEVLANGHVVHQERVDCKEEPTRESYLRSKPKPTPSSFS